MFYAAVLHEKPRKDFTSHQEVSGQIIQAFNHLWVKNVIIWEVESLSLKKIIDHS